MRYRLLCCLLILMTHSTWAALSYEQLQARMEADQVNRGQFVQTKYLAALDVSLRSSGYFEYSPGASINWVTVEPISNQLMISPGSIVSRQAGNELMNLNAVDNPAMSVLSEILFAVITANWGVLESYFDLSGELDEHSWKANLLPKDALVAQVIRRAVLQGDTRVRSITLHEAGENKTLIEFTYRDSSTDGQ